VATSAARSAPNARSNASGLSVRLQFAGGFPLGTPYIVNAERDPVVVPEIEFGEIAVQVFLAHVLINAVDPALEDREEISAALVDASPRTYSF
jgi:hypothetical protein